MLLSEVSVRRPVFAAVISLILVIVGVMSATSMTIREYPAIERPIVSVSTNYRGAASDIVERRVTQVLEDQLAGISGITKISSVSYDERSTISLEFTPDIDIDDAANDVRDRVSRLLNLLPDEADSPIISKQDASAETTMWMGPGEPQKGTGVMKNSWTLGDRFLHHDYHATEGPFPGFAGSGYWGYNRTTQEYEGVWLDTASTALQVERGTKDGNVWTMTGAMKCPATGADVQKKSVVTLQSKDHHTLEMFFVGPDGNEMKAMEIQYRRQGSKNAQ